MENQVLMDRPVDRLTGTVHRKQRLYNKTLAGTIMYIPHYYWLYVHLGAILYCLTVFPMHGYA